MGTSAVPANTLTPGSYGQFDDSGALSSSPDKPKHRVLFGHKLSGGTASANELHEIAGKTDGDLLFDANSHLAAMCFAFKDANPNVKVSAMAVAEIASGGVAATGLLVFTGPATEDGIIALYLGGQLVEVTVLTGDTAAEIATATVAAIAAASRMIVTSEVGGTGDEHKVTITFRHKGVIGNFFMLEYSRLREEVDAFPAGVTLTITAMASGAGAPQIAAAIAALPEEDYDGLCIGFVDDTSLDLFEAEAVRRYGTMIQLDSVVFAGHRGNYGAASSYGNARNCELSTVVEVELSPTPPWIAAADYCAVHATENDPARPLNGLVLPHVVAPLVGVRLKREERNLLLLAGLTTTKVIPGDRVVIERALTTYRKDGSNIFDPKFLDLTTPTTLSYLRWSWNQRMTSKFPRHKIGNDGDRLEPGQPIVTPLIARGETLVWAEEMVFKGLIEDFEYFKTNLIVRRSTSDVSAMEFLLPPDLVNGLHVLKPVFVWRL